VLVFHDLLGIYAGGTARFVKRYAEIKRDMVDGVSRYAAEVRSRSFPQDEHTYGIDAEQLDAFRRYLDQESLASSAWDW
jgi:3-methyl-2-oxobutanoate hydroxymethyltransferase